MPDDRYEQLLAAHSDLRSHIWALLMVTQNVTAFSHVSDFTNDELVERLRVALKLKAQP